jgi:Reverse transcriptase (RNA-dependent DNA polymerase)
LSLTNLYTKRQRIAELARSKRGVALSTLHYVIDLEWLREAYRLTRKDGATGIDGVKAADYAENLEANLLDLLGRIKSGSYQAPPVRRAYIPKADGSRRPLGLPTFEDKVCQRAAVMVLEAVYEQDFLPCSYGFRPGRSAHQALQELRTGVPAMIRWPSKIKAGQVSNEMFSGLDWFPTLLAAAGDTTVRARLLSGWAPTSGAPSFKVHLDGYNQLPYLTGQEPKGARTDFAYYDDDGVLVAFRHENWKAVFCEQKKPGGFGVWYELRSWRERGVSGGHIHTTDHEPRVRSSLPCRSAWPLGSERLARTRVRVAEILCFLLSHC